PALLPLFMLPFAKPSIISAGDDLGVGMGRVACGEVRVARGRKRAERYGQGNAFIGSLDGVRKESRKARIVIIARINPIITTRQLQLFRRTFEPEIQRQ